MATQMTELPPAMRSRTSSMLLWLRDPMIPIFACLFFAIISCGLWLQMSMLSIGIIVEEEAACARILESGIVDRSAAASVIPEFPEAATPPQSGHLLFHRHFFPSVVVERASNVARLGAVIAGVSVLAGVWLACLLPRRRG